jgi:hypothetical protein
MAGVVLYLVTRYQSKGPATILSISLVGWLAYVGLIGHAGILANTTMRPPGPVFLFIPVMLFLLIFAVRTWFAANRPGHVAIPIAVLLSIQTFRVIVELFIHQLWRDGVVPGMLTYSGANVDIYIGATAPFVAWLSTRRKWGRGVAVVWNILGLLALANVVSRAVLSAPGPLNLIHTEVPNLMFGTFPFMVIPGFFVPLAVALHLTALRVLLGKNQTSNI